MPCKTHASGLLPGRGSGMNGEERSAVRARRWIQRSSSGARAATRQHTVNPRRAAVVPSGVSGILKFDPKTCPERL